MTIWVASREYAGIAEAGGVKNVACSLSESLVKLGNRVILFIPLYGCTILDNLDSFNCMHRHPVSVTLCGKTIPITFSEGELNGVSVVFIGNKCFSEKQAVYTYTQEEEQQNPEHKKGNGHQDMMFMDTLFQKAVVAYCETCAIEEAPDIIHCHDASTAMIPAFIKDKGNGDLWYHDFYSSSRCLVTIHNAGPGYHHEFSDYNQAQYFTHLDPMLIEQARNGNSIEPFLLGALNGTLTTVSPEYANEIITEKTETGGLSGCFREKNLEILGITNGIDFDRYDPVFPDKSELPFAYDPISRDFKGKLECRNYFYENFAGEGKYSSMLYDKGIETYGYLEEADDAVYFAFHGRVVEQKGIRVLCAAADLALQKDPDLRFIFMGQGQDELERLFLNLALKHEGKVIFFRGYEKALTRLCLASGDFSLIPSIFEPCCLEDFIAQIFGTLPIAHNTGGLGKIIDGKTGWLYSPNIPEVLVEKIIEAATAARSQKEALENMKSYAATYVRDKYSWDKVAKNEYMQLFYRLKS